MMGWYDDEWMRNKSDQIQTRWEHERKERGEQTLQERLD
jgi:hypothetical protein